MGRLVGAIVLFITTMLGWRIVNSPAVQRNTANTINNPAGNTINSVGNSTGNSTVAQTNLNNTQPLPQPRSTGFSSRVEPSPTPTATPTNPIAPINPSLPSPGPTPTPPNRGQLW